MKQMKWIVLGMSMMVGATLQASGVCLHCEEIREDNKLHHKNYEYYEDYLKDSGGAQKNASEESKNEPQKTPQQPIKNNSGKKNKNNKSKSTKNTEELKAPQSAEG